MRVLIFLFISFKLFSQDTIRFTNDEQKAVKIREVGVENIKYHNFNNLEGPVYIVPKHEVRSVKYSGGLVEVYTNAPKQSEVHYQQNVNKQNSVKTIQIKDTTFYKLDVLSGKVVYKNRAISDKHLRNLIYEYPNQSTKNAMTLEAENLKTYKKRQIGFLVGGLAGAGGIVYGGLYITFLNWTMGDSAPDGLWPVVLGSAFVFGITGPLVSNHYKNKRVKTKAKITKLYNEGR